MSLFVIGDPHLSLSVDKPMDVFKGWENHTDRIKANWNHLVTNEDTVLDIGCGSGILAIAAMLLGAEKGFGVDIDPVAVKTATENGKMNGIDECDLQFVCGDLADKVTEKYSIVVANIVADIIKLFSTQVRAFMLPGAKFIASGIIDTRADEVCQSLEEAGLKIVRRIENGGWVCLVCE